MPRLTLVVERKPVHVYDIGLFVINIGRGEDMHVRIDNVSVSRRQAQIRLEKNGIWTVQDLGSANGTSLNGRRLTSALPLKAGDQISFGKFSLFFDGATAAPVAEADVVAKGSPAGVTDTFYMSAEDAECLRRAVALQGHAQLQWEAKGKRGTFYLDGAAALVGRSALCDLQVPAGPKHHLLVLRTKAGFEVRNLSWWYRMRVNGWVCEQSLLTSRDVIGVGGLRLTFVGELAPRTHSLDRAAEPAPANG